MQGRTLSCCRGVTLRHGLRDRRDERLAELVGGVVSPIGVRRVSGAIAVNRSATIMIFTLPSRDQRDGRDTMRGCTDEP